MFTGKKKIEKEKVKPTPKTQIWTPHNQIQAILNFNETKNEKIFKNKLKYRSKTKIKEN